MTHNAYAMRLVLYATRLVLFANRLELCLRGGICKSILLLSSCIAVGLAVCHALLETTNRLLTALTYIRGTHMV